MATKKPDKAKKAPVKVDSLLATWRDFAPILSTMVSRARGYRITLKWNEEAQHWGEWIEEIADEPPGTEPATDGPEDRQPAIDARVDLLRHYARLADAEAPNLRKIGIAGLRRLAAQLLEADPAVRRLRALGGDERMHRLVQYAKEPGSGYPPARGHRPRFLEAAAQRLGFSERQIERWLKEAQTRNLLP